MCSFVACIRQRRRRRLLRRQLREFELSCTTPGNRVRMRHNSAATTAEGARMMHACMHALCACLLFLYARSSEWLLSAHRLSLVAFSIARGVFSILHVCQAVHSGSQLTSVRQFTQSARQLTQSGSKFSQAINFNHAVNSVRQQGSLAYAQCVAAVGPEAAEAICLLGCLLGLRPRRRFVS